MERVSCLRRDTDLQLSGAAPGGPHRVDYGCCGAASFHRCVWISWLASHLPTGVLCAIAKPSSAAWQAKSLRLARAKLSLRCFFNFSIFAMDASNRDEW